MKRLLQAAATAAIVAAAFSPAQAVVIGTADSENALPFGSSNSGTAFVYQQVYNKTDFGGPIDITRITFYDAFGTTGGDVRGGNFRIFLSTTATAVGGTLGIPPGGIASLTEVYNATLPTLSSGRLDFTGLPAFHYDPAAGNLLLTILAFDASTLVNPLRLDFSTSNGGTLYDWSIADGPSQPNRGLVTGFNDVPSPEIGETPIPAVGAGLPLILGAGGLVRYLRRRRAAQVA